MTQTSPSAPPSPGPQPTAPTAPRLRVNFSWTLAGNLTYAACQWGMLVALAKLGSSEVVGQYAYALAVTAPVFQLSNLQLRAIQATDAAHRFRFEDLYRLRLLASGAALVVACAIGAASTRGTALLVVAAIAVAKAAESLSDIVYGLLQREERMDVVARSMVLRGAVGLLAIAAGMGAGGLPVGAIALAAAWGIVFGSHDRRAARRALASGLAAAQDSPTITPGAALGAVVRTALPLGLVMFLGSLVVNAPRYVIEREAGTSALGVFAALSYLLTAGSMIVAALGQSASPRLSRQYAARDVRAFRRLLLRLLGIALALGLGGVTLAAVAGGPILTLLYSPEYAVASTALVWIAAAGTLTYLNSILGYGLTSVGAYRIQLPITVVELLLTAGGAALLVPRLGLDGAAMALLVSAAARLVLSAGVLAGIVRDGARAGGET